MVIVRAQPIVLLIDTDDERENVSTYKNAHTRTLYAAVMLKAAGIKNHFLSFQTGLN